MKLFNRHSQSSRQPTSSGQPLMNQFSSGMTPFFAPDFGLLTAPSDLLVGQWQPNIDVQYKDKEVIIRADMPGVKEEDLTLSLEDNILSIKGVREKQVSEDKENYRYFEHSYGEFFRSIELPQSIDSDNIKARYNNGVLEIKVPRIKSATQKAIPVVTD